MDIGISSLKDALEVVLIPFSVALLALIWPTMAAWRRRRNFENLVRRELAEATPHHLHGATLWHRHLTRRFLHERIIQDPASDTDFVLSLNPELSYHLSQMWIEYAKGQEAAEDRLRSSTHAGEFCWHLKKTVDYLGFGHGPESLGKVWENWATLVRAQFPDLPPSEGVPLAKRSSAPGHGG